MVFVQTIACSQSPDSLLSTEDTYHLVYDGLYDMNGSARNLLSVSHLFGRGLDEISIRHDSTTGRNYYGEKGNVIGRLFNSSLNFLFTDWVSTVQHEAMGHGFRVREFNVPISRYDISSPMFGDPQIYFKKDELPFYGKLLYDVGGSESNTVFAREAFRQSLTNDRFYHYYIYGFALKLDLPLYIIGSPAVDSKGWNTYLGGGWDVVDYVKDFAKGSGRSEKEVFRDAKRGAAWSLVDPSLLISVFNYFRDFIGRGRIEVKSPMIKINQVAFLPFTDFHLSPFGSEYYGGTYLKHRKTLFETYYRWSNGNPDGQSHGIGVNVLRLVQMNDLKFDAGMDLWKQGFNLLYHNSNDDKYFKNVVSGKVYLRGDYQLNKTFSFQGQISYKGGGFVIGYPVKHGVNGKFGVGIFF